MNGLTFPAVFANKPVDYPNTTKGKLLACADALSAWATVMAGKKPPENFGQIMQKLSEHIGCLGTPDCISQASKILLKKKKGEDLEQRMLAEGHTADLAERAKKSCC